MKNQRGVTLIELMIVVAIVGILAGIASIAYARYMTSAQIEKLKTYALAAQSGQERFRSRNNLYWNGGLLNAASEADYANLLDFSHPNLPADITITTEAWDGEGGQTCNICAGAPFDDTVAGYAVVVTKDFKAGGEATTLVVTHITPDPVLLFEGE